MSLTLAASSVSPVSFTQLSRAARRVSVGQVERLTSYKDAQSGRIFTTVEIRESHAVAGASPPASFTFEMAGGTVGDVRQWIAGFPQLEAGDRVALFLAEDTATPLGPTVGLWQGVFFLDGGKVLNHRRQVVVDIRGEELVVDDAASNKPGAPARASAPALTLDAFLSRISALRAGAGK